MYGLLTWRELIVVNDMSARIDELEKSLEKVIQQDENEQTQQ